MTTNEVIAKVNAQVIAGLTKQGLKWFKPFKDVNGNLVARNAQKKAYKGWNQFVLTSVAKEHNWINQWITFNECVKRGGKVKKGEHGTMICFWNLSWRVDNKYYNDINEVPAAQKKDCKQFMQLKYYFVFSLSQTDIEVKQEVVEELPELDTNDLCNRIVEAWSKEVKLVNSSIAKACYNPSKDEIHMPTMEAKIWKKSDDYYKVFFHEAVHSTGHKTRLNRELAMQAQFKSVEYSKEELVAELGAMYLEALTGIEPEIDNHKNSQAYINGWISKLNKEPNTIMTASSESSKAIDLILTKTGIEL